MRSGWPAASASQGAKGFIDRQNDRESQALDPQEWRDLLEIVDGRCDAGSILITSQRPLENWHDIIGDPTIADAALDRFSASRASLHNAYRIELSGESLRKTRGQNARA